MSTPTTTAVSAALALCVAVWASGAIALTNPDDRGLFSVTALRCEGAENPLGVDVARPRLSWQLQSSARGAAQTSYRVIVSSTPELLEQDKGDLWDSGTVRSSQTSGIRYDGRPLASSQKVYWRVKVTSNTTKIEPIVTPAGWTMGLLSPGDWKGEWIKTAAPTSNRSTLMRRAFAVRPGLTRAVAHVSGLGQYELNVNGRKSGDDLLAPAWTDYRKTIAYDTHDVTALLLAGDNAIGLTLADGMHNVTRPSGRFAKFVGSFGDQRAILHLRLDYSDGQTEFVGTDSSWKTRDGPVTYAGIYSGEDYDARKLPAGWDRAAFDDKDWTPAVAAGRADDTLHGLSASAEPVRAIDTLKPIKATPFPDGSIVYDFGQNASFMPRLKLTGPAGSTVRLTAAEVANPDGRIFRGTMGGASRGSAWWQYTKATDGEENWFPQFYYVGSRYLHAERVPAGREPSPPSLTRGVYPQTLATTQPSDLAVMPKIESIEAVVVHSSAAPVGSFETSSPLLNRIRENVRWAQRSNMMSIITDCPHREKLGWLEQMHMNGPAIRYEFAMNRLFAKSMRDMADAQLDDGLVPNVAPEYVKFKNTFRAAAEWGAAFIQVPWQQYQFDGDADLLRQHYAGMKRYFDYLTTKVDGEGILSDGLGDWYDLGPAKPGKAQLTPPPVTATAFYFENARTMARIAELLGHADDAKTFADAAERTRGNYNRKFFNADAGTYATGSQCSNAIALAMDIVEAKDRPRVLEALIQDVQANAYGMTAGDVGFRYLLRALADAGRSDIVYKIVTQDEKPGYAKQVKDGETTLTESWDANRGSSHNHFMLGHVTEWFYKDLAGIDVDPAGPGFKKIFIRPNPVGALTKVDAAYQSVHGKIASRWDRDGERLVLTVDIPPNTTATVFVPARTEQVAPPDGATFLRREGDRSVFAVGSGRYVFASDW